MPHPRPKSATLTRSVAYIRHPHAALPSTDTPHPSTINHRNPLLRLSRTRYSALISLLRMSSYRTHLSPMVSFPPLA